MGHRLLQVVAACAQLRGDLAQDGAPFLQRAIRPAREGLGGSLQALLDIGSAHQFMAVGDQAGGRIDDLDGHGGSP